jgi:hypothetical protein
VIEVSPVRFMASSDLSRWYARWLSALVATLLVLASTSAAGALPSSTYDYDVTSTTVASTTARGIDPAVRPNSTPSVVSGFNYDSPGFRYATNAIPTPSQAQGLVAEGTPVRSALQSDAFHRAPAFVVDDIAENATVFRITGGDGVQRTLVQMPGAVDDIAGRFEWIVDDLGNITHQFFVKGGSINGIPITP